MKRMGSDNYCHRMVGCRRRMGSDSNTNLIDVDTIGMQWLTTPINALRIRFLFHNAMPHQCLLILFNSTYRKTSHHHNVSRRQPFLAFAFDLRV